jgi:hypothetical protein
MSPANVEQRELLLVDEKIQIANAFFLFTVRFATVEISTDADYPPNWRSDATGFFD